MSNHRDLEVWNRALELAAEVYRVTGSIPSEERYGLTSQIRRSAVSVPSNIAEGSGRGGTQELLHFLRIANGSLQELETQLEIAVRVGYLPPQPKLKEEIDHIGRMLSRLRAALQKKVAG